MKDNSYTIYILTVKVPDHMEFLVNWLQFVRLTARLIRYTKISSILPKPHDAIFDEDLLISKLISMVIVIIETFYGLYIQFQVLGPSASGLQICRENNN